MQDNIITDSHDSLDLLPDSRFIKELTIAVKDLLWISESEYPFQVVYWHNLDDFSQETLLQQNNYDPDTKVTIKEFKSFFSSVIKEQEWHNKEEQAEVQRYQLLVSLLAKNLQNIQVYRLGEIEIDVYILGRTKHKAIAGLFTKIVET